MWASLDRQIIMHCEECGLTADLLREGVGCPFRWGAGLSPGTKIHLIENAPRADEIILYLPELGE